MAVGFEDSLIDLSKPLYLFEDFALGVVEVGLGLPDREVSASGLGMAVACGERARKYVEAAADAVNDRTKPPPEEWIEGLDLGEAVALVAGFAS